jgi:hypothetical protein
LTRLAHEGRHHLGRDAAGDRAGQVELAVVGALAEPPPPLEDATQGVAVGVDDDRLGVQRRRLVFDLGGSGTLRSS